MAFMCNVGCWREGVAGRRIWVCNAQLRMESEGDVMSRNALVKKGKMYKGGAAVAAVGAVGLFVFGHPILGALCTIAAIGLFIGVMRTFASTGQRF